MYQSGFYVIMVCSVINLVFLFLVVRFTTAFEYWEQHLGILVFALCLAYLTLLNIPSIIISRLKTSIEEEKEKTQTEQEEKTS